MLVMFALQEYLEGAAATTPATLIHWVPTFSELPPARHVCTLLEGCRDWSALRLGADTATRGHTPHLSAHTNNSYRPHMSPCMHATCTWGQAWRAPGSALGLSRAHRRSRSGAARFQVRFRRASSVSTARRRATRVQSKTSWTRTKSAGMMRPHEMTVVRSTPSSVLGGLAMPAMIDFVLK